MASRRRLRLCRLLLCPPLVISLCQLVVASPLVILLLHHPLVDLSRQLVVTLPFAILSLHHPLVLSLRQLVVPLPLLVLSLGRPLVLLSSCVAPRRATLSTSLCLVVSPLVILSRQLVVASFFVGCPLVAPLSRPLIMTAGCCVASSCVSLLSSRCAHHLCLTIPLPSSIADAIKKFVKRCCRHRTPLSPPSLNTISIIHRCHSCCPLPPLNTNAHLCPSTPSNADAPRCHTPPLMSVSIFASLAYP